MEKNIAVIKGDGIGPEIVTEAMKVLDAVAKKYNADLIVMGSRGLGPLKGLFMGSVSSYVTSHSTCPVLIIK